MKIITLIVATTVIARSAGADVTAITDEAQWQATVGSYTTVDFTEYPEFTTITTQYAALGITFTDGNDFIRISAFPTDDHGLVSSDGFGNPGTIHMAFHEPQYWLAFDFIGDLEIELYRQGELVFASNQYVADFTPFVGFISTMPFDAAIARDSNDDVVAVGDIHFGPPIPAPAALALFGLAAALALRRTRCDS